ncbi:outer membrane efflux protein [Phocaeicola salanitronis DSM 18170]|uniref:Outer membrane efflux protein n=1 Tax=Phocaeicola salanitronis (strain DSM 18170 / JCM 13657 / CCUG 60908 / BL78) TaxID=667015 RepID=F0QZS3_PHOSB|nr:TolC family protein [Phocaeicola salanitronis]ADY37193.1 outer membrane efflux protein [Phocaeicola salanitronis DSM 18170]
MKKILNLVLLLTLALASHAQRVLTLDSCRALALANNKELRMSQEKVKAAHYEQKAAFTNFLPKIDVGGTYMRIQKEISLLSDAQKNAIGNVGTAVGAQLQQFGNQLQQIAVSHPELLPLLEPLSGVMGQLPGALNGVGQGIVDAFRTDTRNLYAGAATLTQPIFMGGKIIAYNKITKYAEQLAASQHATGMQDVVMSTDQAYWQVISLVNKKRLAESFVELVRKLDSDVNKMLEEGVATQADALSVRVKVNEAEMALVQVEDGLSLSKMVLCQLCGLPLDTEIRLADEEMEDLALPDTFTESNVNTALANREELKSLELASKIYRQKVNVARAGYLPSIGLTASYLFSNPSLFNGFENKFRGTWGIGVVVTIPVFHWGENIYKVRAAKAEANIARYRLDDAREKIELQVTQNSYKVNEAAKKLAMAEKNMEKAEENLRYANFGFREGVIPTSNVLEAQTAWLSAQSGKIDAQIDLKMSEIYLNKSMGTLDMYTK